MSRNDPRLLAERVRAGEVRAVAQAISAVESDRPIRDALIHALDPDGSVREGVRIVGLTGPPGAGKSTLISSLIVAARDAGDRVAVLAFDPTSPFSGGALLGDRLRMNRHRGGDGVYIRSMATRGHGGGLSAAALEAATVLGAAGFNLILVESVGVGQTEVGILSIADLVTVVLNPGTGDEIQTLKAGVMEIGDVYVVNKADLDGAADLERALQRAELRTPETDRPPVIARTIAETGEGVTQLYATVMARLEALAADGALSRRRERGLAAAVQQLAGDLFRRWVEERGIVPAGGAVPFGELRARLAAVLADLGDREVHDD